MACCMPSCVSPEPPLHSHSSLCKEHRQECLCYYTLRAAPGAIPVSSVPPASSRHLSNRQRDAGATWLEPTDYAETCLSSIAPHSRGDRRFRPCRKEPLREIPHPPRRARTAAFRRAANSPASDSGPRIRDSGSGAARRGAAPKSRMLARRCTARQSTRDGTATADFTVARRR